jgi:hypothetical protein
MKVNLLNLTRGFDLLSQGFGFCGSSRKVLHSDSSSLPFRSFFYDWFP